MLNQSDVAKGTNKFYQIQLLKSKTKQTYYLYKRWGRVGVDDVSLNLFLPQKQITKKKKQTNKHILNQKRTGWWS